MGNFIAKKGSDLSSFSKKTIQDLQGTLVVEHTYSKLTSKKLRHLLHQELPLRTLGAYNGQQAVQYVKAGLQAIYVSGWQVAACSNTSGETYPDQSLYPVDSVPKTVYGIIQALLRADKIQWRESPPTILPSCSLPSPSPVDFVVPLVADGEAGFGGPLNAFELTRKMIEAGAAAIHFEDQVAAEKKCGHLGGKVLVPTSHFVKMLRAARLAAAVENCPDFVVIARTDAESAQWISSDVDANDEFILRHEPRSPEGFYRFHKGLQACIARGLVYAEVADLVWFETSTPDLKVARQFAEAIHTKFPRYPLAYNCSPSFHWSSHLSEEQLQSFQMELGNMGYRFQFVTLAAFHATNLASFDVALDYAERGMLGYSDMQQREFSRVEKGYTAVRHQQEVGTAYFDAVAEALGSVSTRAMKDSTEASQFLHHI
jgi:isocitrate lyase